MAVVLTHLFKLFCFYAIVYILGTLYFCPDAMEVQRRLEIMSLLDCYVTIARTVCSRCGKTLYAIFH